MYKVVVPSSTFLPLLKSYFQTGDKSEQFGYSSYWTPCEAVAAEGVVRAEVQDSSIGRHSGLIAVGVS